MDGPQPTGTIDSVSSDSPTDKASKAVFVSIEEKSDELNVSGLPSFENDSERNLNLANTLSGARDLVSEILSTEDDPSQSPWTFRMWFIGIGMSLFAGTVTTMNAFKPQSIHIQLVFLVVLTYVLGKAMEKLLPRRGWIGRLINPGPFNKKEHSAICIMCSAASSTPEAMQVLAVQKLYYNIRPTPIVGVLLLLSAQMIGYGGAGLLRKTLVYPSNMLYPKTLPTASLLENLHQDNKSSRAKKMKVFQIAFWALFIWQTFPQYIAPIFAGVSVFCLAIRHDLVITNLFGGSSANEGLGFLSFSFDWSMVGAHGNPLWIPFQTLINGMIGYILSIGLYMGLYYGNFWNARHFPFISQQLFSEKSNSTRYVQYNQTAILNSHYGVDPKLLEKQGLPWITSSYAFGMTAVNIAVAAAISHMLLWHWDDIKSALDIVDVRKLFKKDANWKFWKQSGRKLSLEEAHAIDPHYRLMQAYEDAPSWWFGSVWIISVLVGFVASRLANSTLEWWAFALAILISSVALTFFAALTAISGFPLKFESLIQMIGAYALPGRPLANLYFSAFGYNSMHQAISLLGDLKLGQYVHLAPKCTFTMQVVGTTIGCIMSYVMMEQITTEKRDILLAIEGTNVWSGQSLQKINSGAITWGGLASHLYGKGARYQMVSLAFLIGLALPIPFWLLHKAFPRLRLNYWNTSIICGYIHHLSEGATSGFLLHYVAGFVSQFWLRRYRSRWFVKYNYILSAGMDGGAQVIGFLLTITVFGAGPGGKSVRFPPYWGNAHNKGNLDYCMKDPGLGKGKKHHGGGVSKDD